MCIYIYMIRRNRPMNFILQIERKNHDALQPSCSGLLGISTPLQRTIGLISRMNTKSKIHHGVVPYLHIWRCLINGGTPFIIHRWYCSIVNHPAMGYPYRLENVKMSCGFAPIWLLKYLVKIGRRADDWETPWSSS